MRTTGRELWWAATGIGLAAWLGLCATESAAQPQRHLFLDPALLVENENATLRVNPPERREAVIKPDRPWENLMIGFFLTVRDEDGVLRMWYMCGDRDGQQRRSYPLAYAESNDGVRWTKPNLGLVDYRGSKDNNLVGLPYWEGVVLRDPNGRDDQRYVYVSNVDGEGVVRFHSPDGLRWQRDAERLLPFRADTQNVTLWDARLQRYVLYLRAWDMTPGWDHRLRVVGRLTAERLDAPLPFEPSGRGDNPRNPRDRPRIAGEIPVVFAADQRDPVATDVYNLAAQLYPPDERWYVAFPSFYRHFDGGTAANDGRLDVHFAGSSDGVNWHRYDRTPYLALGLADSDRSSVIYMGAGLVVRGEEIWHYAATYRTTHKVEGRERPTDGTIYRYVQRIDGFVSLDFGDARGRVTTKPIEVDGPRLFANVDTGALGELRIGLRDADGRAIPGFAVEDCDPIQTNATRARASWRGSGDTAVLWGRRVQLEFSGTRAKLYSVFFD